MAYKPETTGASEEAPSTKDEPSAAPQIFADRGPQDNVATSTYSPGPQMFDPSIAAAGGGRSYAGGLTATAGGTRAAAARLPGAINRITTCATAADSVYLPPALGGQEISLINSGAAACQVFAAPGTSDTINGVAAATGISVAAAGKAMFVSPGPGLWFSILSA